VSRILRLHRRAAAWIGIALAFECAALAQVTERVSLDTAGVQGNGSSFATPTIEAAASADGRYVAFWSDATNLVAGDVNSRRDVFVRDRQTGTTELISVNSSEIQANEESFDPTISADGRYVAFTSHATNLVPGPTNGSYDVYLRDRQAGTTVRVSVDSAGVEGNGTSSNAAISADGRFIAFQSLASNLAVGDTNGVHDVYVHDSQTGTTERVSVSTGGSEGDGESIVPSISSDGRYLAFESAAANLVAGDSNAVNDIFLRDRQLATTARLSLTTGGVQGNDASAHPAVSEDGRFVAFHSLATNLVAGDTNAVRDVFLHDRTLVTTERVSLDSAAVQGNGSSARASVSADGRFLAFTSAATNLVADDTNGGTDIFVRDRQTATTERASVQSGGAQAGSLNEDAWITPNGRYVVFTSLATDLVPDDTNGSFDVFLRDRQPGSTDTDGDGILDGSDNCPAMPNADQANADGDASGDVCDTCTDTDGDGFGNPGFAANACPADGCPDDPGKSASGICGCGISDADTDGDGTPNCLDGCPSDPGKIAPGICGCGIADGDLDGDGVVDCLDGCPDDPAKIAPGACGCGVADTDGDGDGTADCNDACPSDPAKQAPGPCGCGAPDSDGDGDGTADCNDGCPNDPAKSAPGQCGCGTPETDNDGDATPNCLDGCPDDPTKTEPGENGCGVPEGEEEEFLPGRKPGSLLIFPEFDNRVGDITEFTVTNTNTDLTYDPRTNLPSGTIRVHFVYVGRFDSAGQPIHCLEVDREVTLSPGDSYTFLTRTHNPQQQQGFMYAFAQHPTSGQAISFNHLIGSALFINGINAIDYSTNPVCLESPKEFGSSTDIDGDGNRDLDGLEYRKLPDEILIPRFLTTGGALRSELVLLGLSGGAQFDTIVDFVIYNDNEEVFSAQHQFRCWERAPLDTLSGIFTQSFLATTNHAVNEPLGAPGRESGWMQLDGSVAFSHVEQIDDPAIYAVLVERVARGAGASDLPFEAGTQGNGSLWPNGPFGDNQLGDGR